MLLLIRRNYEYVREVDNNLLQDEAFLLNAYLFNNNSLNILGGLVFDEKLTHVKDIIKDILQKCLDKIDDSPIGAAGISSSLDLSSSEK